jgi:hypothetical protein
LSSKEPTSMLLSRAAGSVHRSTSQSQTSASLAVAPVERQTCLIHVYDPCFHLVGKIQRSVWFDCSESIFDDKLFPAVKPQIQILVRGPADAAVLGTIHLLRVDVSCCVADDSIENPCCRDCPNVQSFCKHQDYLRPRVFANARIHLVDWYEALVRLA